MHGPLVLGIILKEKNVTLMNLQIKLVKHLTKGRGLGYLAARDTDAEKTVFVAHCLVSEHLSKLYQMQFVK